MKWFDNLLNWFADKCVGPDPIPHTRRIIEVFRLPLVVMLTPTDSALVVDRFDESVAHFHGMNGDEAKERADAFVKAVSWLAANETLA